MHALRPVALVLVLAAVACGGGGGGSSNKAAESSSSTPASSSGPSSISFNLKVTVPPAAVVDPVTPSFLRDSSDKSCGAGTPGSLTGFDETGKVEVKDRAGKLLAAGKIPHGSVEHLQTASAGEFTRSTFDCDFRVTVKVYEQPTDLALFTFSWPVARQTITKDVTAQEFAQPGLILTEIAS